MSERTSDFETTVNSRIKNFIATHAEEALLWFVVSKDGEVPQTYISHVEFETSENNRNDRLTEGLEEYSYRAMDVYTEAGIYSEPISVEYDVDVGVDLSDLHGTLSVILDDPNANQPSNYLESVNRLMDHLESLESCSFLIPAYRRQYDTDT